MRETNVTKRSLLAAVTAISLVVGAGAVADEKPPWSPYNTRRDLDRPSTITSAQAKAMVCANAVKNLFGRYAPGAAEAQERGAEFIIKNVGCDIVDTAMQINNNDDWLP
jgi:hypothetical protein